MNMFSKFCTHDSKRFRSENSFLQLVWHKKVSPLAWHFLCLTLQKTIFRSLPLHIWTQFGEQIAISKTIPWLIEGRKKEVYFLEEKNRQIREIRLLLLFFANKTPTPIPRKCITWLCFHIEIDWERSRMGWGFMQNQTYCICILDGAKNLQNLKLNSI